MYYHGIKLLTPSPPAHSLEKLKTALQVKLQVVIQYARNAIQRNFKYLGILVLHVSTVNTLRDEVLIILLVDFPPYSI